MVHGRDVPMLDTIRELESLPFGEFPRRGFHLLHWLSHDWIKFSNADQMFGKTNPENGQFGFHAFHNMEKILPDIPPYQSGRYYEVGNLHTPRAQELPFDTRSNKQNNVDRIIVRRESNRVISAVYITQHVPHHNCFSAEATYHLSKPLIRHISHCQLHHFLQEVGYESTVNFVKQSAAPAGESTWSCTIL